MLHETTFQIIKIYAIYALFVFELVLFSSWL
jgi:hypothetical protein